MGLVLDSSILIADERGRFDMPGFLRQANAGQPCISSITASELLHGVERASDPERKLRRQRHVEQILASLRVNPLICLRRVVTPGFGQSWRGADK